jgi:serine palmitoyltransferase
VIERETVDGYRSFQNTDRTRHCINLGSYNYLGFADDWKITCRKPVMEATHQWPLSMCSSRMDHGSIKLHEDLEKTVAEFVGKEAAIVYAMGYDTNASTIPAIMGPESLIISDSLNHTSLVNGARGAAGAQIRVFRHNDIDHLESIVREAIIKGQPRFRRPWKKIMVMVEGIYSMEGDICNLAEVVKICKKYKAFLYVDEAHSIGALGKTGRGVCEYRGVDPKDVGKWENLPLFSSCSFFSFPFCD